MSNTTYYEYPVSLIQYGSGEAGHVPEDAEVETRVLSATPDGKGCVYLIKEVKGYWVEGEYIHIKPKYRQSYVELASFQTLANQQYEEEQARANRA